MPRYRVFKCRSLELHPRARRNAANSGVREVPPGPYNLVVTSALVLLAPRTRESFKGVSINALGFAASLLVRSSEQLARIRELGPLRLLTEVSEPVS